MDFIKIRFGTDLDNLSSKFEKTIEEMFRSANPLFNCSECSWKPPVDIYETQEEIIIIAELAGVKKEEVELEINSKVVKISGQRSGATEVKNGTYRLAEIQYGQFERILFLPFPIDTEKVNATYSNGFLKIQLAKLSGSTTHKVPISEG
jgi:HSP20 family protein